MLELISKLLGKFIALLLQADDPSAGDCAVRAGAAVRLQRKRAPTAIG